MDLSMDQVQAQLDKLGRLPRGYRMAMLPAIAIVLIAAYAYFLYLPAKATLERSREQYLQAQRKLSEVRAVAANEEAVKAEIEMLEQKLAVALR
jgi:type II secretory pathway component PulM